MRFFKHWSWIVVNNGNMLVQQVVITSLLSLRLLLWKCKRSWVRSSFFCPNILRLKEYWLITLLVIRFPSHVKMLSSRCRDQNWNLMTYSFPSWASREIWNPLMSWGETKWHSRSTFVTLLSVQYYIGQIRFKYNENGKHSVII